jgi:hypothetical protein
MALTPGSDPVVEVLAELQRLTAAVSRGGWAGEGSPGGRRRPNRHQASVAFDYLALQELLGRQDPTGTTSRFVTVSRKGSTLRLFDLPHTAEAVAVFTGPGQPAETVPLGSQKAATTSTPGYHEVTLSTVPASAAITRLEVRDDRRVIRLGPRLEAV